MQNSCDVTTQASPLTESSNINTMQDPIAQELKGLKAAYRTAIGATKKGGKRSKKPKKNNQFDSFDRSEEQQALELNVAPICEGMHQHQHPEGRLLLALNGETIKSDVKTQISVLSLRKIGLK